MDTRAKIVSLEQAADFAARLRREGRRLVVAAGCFDVLQAAHARFLSQSRSDGAALLVAVYDDGSLCRILGQPRPVLGAPARAQLVAALAAVDRVMICSQRDLESWVERLQPNQVEYASNERNIIGMILERHK